MEEIICDSSKIFLDCPSLFDKHLNLINRLNILNIPFNVVHFKNLILISE